MSSNDQPIRDSEVGLDEPHFDEATLLAARPVVPLVEVKAKTRSKARWALTLAIVGGLLVGLLGATFLYRYLGSSELRVAETTAVSEPMVEPQISSGGTVPVADQPASVAVAEEEKPAIEAQPEAEQETKSAPARTDSAPAKAEPPTRNAPRERPVIVRDSPDWSEEEIMQEREIRRARRQEQKREERRAAREARRDDRQRAQTSDDLLRIREIFEGAPRP